MNDHDVGHEIVRLSLSISYVPLVLVLVYYSSNSNLDKSFILHFWYVRLITNCTNGMLYPLSMSTTTSFIYTGTDQKQKQKTNNAQRIESGLLYDDDDDDDDEPTALLYWGRRSRGCN